MVGYLIRRIVAGISVLFMVTVATFTIFFLGPADPAAALCGSRNCSPERYMAIKRSLGLDQPKVEQFFSFLGGIFAGRTLQSGGFVKECPAPCFGYSFIQNRPVSVILAENLPVTVSIALGASVIMLTVGVLIGSYAAINRGTTIDKALVAMSLTLSSLPYYVLALLAFLVLAVQLQIFPRTGYHPLLGDGPFFLDLLKWVQGLLLAWLVLGLVMSTSYARFSRASMIEALGEDFVRTARAKGLSPRRVQFRHALRAALAPVVTIFGLDLAGLMGGTIFTERIFNLKGIGYMAVDAVFNLDLPIIMGTVLFASIVIVAMNIIVDVAYSLIDPRVRLG
ncbi:MAG TPA: ABC transporter permease [Actinopolymorphaceae bacterium]|jgi:peptide/nickel transport system permease protein